MISFEVPAVPKLINTTMGANWRAEHSQRTKWRKWVMLATMGKKPPKPYPFAHIVFVRCTSKEPDDDNLAISFKKIRDALKFCGIIEDDSPRHIKCEYRWLKAKPGKPKTIVTITPLTNI